ncbi:MAG: amidohydrolase [Candidatus Pelethousia sp.]|nr:amidohydrolase [Candidatus Pelethousia sp.]
MGNYLITNSKIMTMNGAGDVLANGYIAIKDSRIQAMGSMDGLDRREYPGYREFTAAPYAKPYVVLPGFIQTHVHTTQTLGRGLADDVDLITWTRKRIWPYEAALSPDDAYISSMLGIAEMIKSGTTMFCEASGEYPDCIAQAILDSGISGTVCLSTMDLPGEIPESLRMTTAQAIERNLALIERWHGKEGRVDACLNILNLFLSSETLWREFTRLSLEKNLLLQSHVSESKSEVEFVKEKTGLTPVRYLNSIGALTPNLLAAHLVFIDDEEIDLLHRNQVNVMHLPAAELRIAGFAPIAKELGRGIAVSLGTNSPPCNNRMSIMDDMWLAGLMHKAIHNDPSAVPAKAVLRMATVNGAKALKREQETGTLAVGKLADITIMDMNKVCSTPVHALESTIVYQATSEVVDTVFARGELLMEHGKLTTIDEGWIIKEAERRAHAITKRAGIVL